MARVTITIDDTVDNTIKVVCTPPMHELIARYKSKEGVSGAHMMAMEACIAMRNLSRGKLNGKNSRLILPDGV